MLPLGSRESLWYNVITLVLLSDLERIPDDEEEDPADESKFEKDESKVPAPLIRNGFVWSGKDSVDVDLRTEIKARTGSPTSLTADCLIRRQSSTICGRWERKSGYILLHDSSSSRTILGLT